MKKKLIKKHGIGGDFRFPSILKDYKFRAISDEFENNWGKKELHKLWIDNLPPSLYNTSIPTKSTDLIEKRDVGPIIPRVNNNIQTPNLVESNAVSKVAKISGKGSGTTPEPTSKNGIGLEKASNIAKGIGMVADAIPRRQDEDPTINTLNSTYDATSNAVAAVPVVGTFISAGMKLIKGVEGVVDNSTGGKFNIKHSGKGGFWGQHNRLSKSSWSRLTASGWINPLTKKNVSASDVDLAKSIDRGYTPAEATAQEEIGGFSQSMAKFWSGKDLIKEAKQRLAKTDSENLRKSNVVYGDTKARISAQNTYGDIASKNQQQLYGQSSTRALSAKKGAKINPASLRNISKKVKAKIPKEEKKEVEQFQQGGTLNVIPEGALHARKHELPDDIKEQVTHKGIPVVTYDDGGEITQHAEIEVNEIIFSKDTTKTLEDYLKEYNKAESDSDKARIAIECGKFLASEILENTDDRTGLLNIVE